VPHEFLAALAHELRNPLAPMRNALAILGLKAPAVPEVQWARGVIERQMTLLTRIVDDLLDVSRISGGDVTLERRRVDLDRVLRAAADANRPALEARGLDLAVAAAPPLFVSGDEARLIQVFAHLIDQSADGASPGGRIRLDASRAGDDVLVSVERDPAETSTSDRPGLGLTLVSRLVELHGGSVQLESGAVGSRCVVRLPAERPAATAADPLHDAHALAHRVLIVDDNGDASDSLGMVLQILGVEFRTAYDGRSALQLAGEFQPDVVLLDIGLPDLDGYEVARRIRAEPWGGAMTLIAVTGWGQDEDKARSAAAGFDRHVVKPLAPEALLKLLAALPPPRQA
jgi:CheY-like chemotaxis protein